MDGGRVGGTTVGGNRIAVFQLMNVYMYCIIFVGSFICIRVLLFCILTI